MWLRRAFCYNEAPLPDLFLMLDDSRFDRPEDYISGFPLHPHGCIERVTYMLEGRMEHGDSIGNAGFVYRGSIQWMTASAGIPEDGKMDGFKL